MTIRMPTTTTGPDAAADTPAPDPNVLRLTSVLASGLPLELGTPDEPARYTVPAVFSRQVNATERVRIEDPAAAAALVERCGLDHSLQLTVSDRRLLIGNTNLAELTGGLASAVAALLREIDAVLDAEQDARTAQATARRLVDTERAATLEAAAAQVHFV